MPGPGFRGRGGKSSFRGKKGKRSGPRLPDEVLEAVRNASGPSGATHAKVSRKDRRKAERTEKKQSKAAHYGTATETKSAKAAPTLKNFKTAGGAGHKSALKVSGKRARSYGLDSDEEEGTHKSRPQVKRPRKTSETESDYSSESDFESDIEDDTPAGHSHAISISGPAAYREEDDPDIALIKTLEKKLGIKRGGENEDKKNRRAITKLNKEFAKDGFGDDFGDFLESLGGNGVSDGEEEKPARKQKKSAPSSESDEDIDEEEDDDDDDSEDDEDDEDDEELSSSEEEDVGGKRVKFALPSKNNKNIISDASDDNSDDNIDGDDDDEEDDDIEDEDEDEVEDDEDEDDDDDDEEEEEDNESDDDESSEEMPELLDETEKQTPTASQSITTSGDATKYVPPHLRKKQEQDLYGRSAPEPTSKHAVTMPARAFVEPAATIRAMEKSAFAQLRKQIQGLVNRLGETNVEPIATELAAVFRGNAMAECNAVLYTVVCDACAAESQVLRPLVMLFGALLSALHVLLGPSVGAYVIEAFTLRLLTELALPVRKDIDDKELKETGEALKAQRASTERSAADEDTSLSALLGDGTGKRASSSAAREKLGNNLILLLAYLVIFQVAPAGLLLDILILLARRFTETDVELLLLALKHVGFELRAEDPAAVKALIQHVQDNIKKITTSTAVATPAVVSKFLPQPIKSVSAPAVSSSRLEVMANLILDIKNNRKRQEQEQIAERGSQLRKWLTRLAAKSTGMEGTDRCLRITFTDLADIPFKGRWWLVGSSWAGRAAAGAGAKPDEEAVAMTDPSAAKLSITPELVKLADKMRMTSGIRRSAFYAIMGAEDVDDALERVIRLNLKGAAEREVVRVLLDCCGQEVAYNPYYASVGQKLCGYNPAFKFTFQLTFWDTFKTFDDPELCAPRRVYNFARLLAALVCAGCCSLSVLKVLDFTTLNNVTTLFLKAFFSAVLLDASSTPLLVMIFSRLGTSDDRFVLRDGIQLFLHNFIDVPVLLKAASTRKMPISKAEDGRSQLKQRIKCATRALDSVKGELEDDFIR